MDMTSISLCRENNIPILIFKFEDIERVVKGEKVGSMISNCVFK